MLENKKIIMLALFSVVLVSVFGFTAKPVIAQESAVYAIQAQIENILRQIISLLQQVIDMKIAQINQESGRELRTRVENEIGRGQNSANAGQGDAILTVNSTGAVAYVSINNGGQFQYVEPIILRDGDKYLVTSSSISQGSSSLSKCSGIASMGGKYICNIFVNQY